MREGVIENQVKVESSWMKSARSGLGTEPKASSLTQDDFSCPSLFYDPEESSRQNSTCDGDDYFDPAVQEEL
jgi:hypothetical protein